MRDLKIIPLFEEVSNIDDDRITSSEIIEEFTKTLSYKTFSKKLNDAASTLDSLLTRFCTRYGEKVSDDELQDAKTRMVDKIIKQYI